MTDDSYSDVADFYQSLVSPESAQGLTIGNPVIAQGIAAFPDRAWVLDAACGLGWDAISAANGLPGVPGPGRRKLHLAASDADLVMVEQTRMNARTFFGNEGFIDVRQSLFEELSNIPDWQKKFDAVLVSYALYTVPPWVSDQGYDDYFIRSMRGLASALKAGGTLWVDFRDWSGVFDQALNSYYHNRHGSDDYHAEYAWSFGATVEDIHTAKIRMWKNKNKERARILTVRYAGRTMDSLRALIDKADFDIVSESRMTGKSAHDAFFTLGLRFRPEMV